MVVSEISSNLVLTIKNQNKMSKFEQDLQDHTAETVSLKVQRGLIYDILKSIDDVGVLANLCQKNIHIPECEAMLSDIEEDWMEYQAHQRTIREEYYSQINGFIS